MQPRRRLRGPAVTLPDVARLVVLAAIWGASFLFMRVAAPPLGPIATADLRVVLASVTLLAWLRFAGIELRWREHWRFYLVVGLITSALPFALWAFSALHLPASYLVVLNATSPIFGALVAALWLGDRLTARVAFGLAAGVAGVAMLVGFGPLRPSPMILWAIAAGAVAALCYAIAAAYMKRRSARVDAAAVATGSQLGASLALAPLLAPLPPFAWPTPGEWAAVVLLGVLCTGIAYLLYFRLIADVGPTRALTVTFLIPAFGMLWGALFLGEAITPTMAAGCGLVLVGTALTLWRPARAPLPAAIAGDPARNESVQ
ncbi:MAG: DMT family transporter [Vicinamibacteria bacterium]